MTYKKCENCGANKHTIKSGKVVCSYCDSDLQKVVEKNNNIIIQKADSIVNIEHIDNANFN